MRRSNFESTPSRVIGLQHILRLNPHELQQREGPDHHPEGRQVYGHQIFSGVHVQRRNKRRTRKSPLN